MKEGFAAHLITIGTTQYKSAIAIIDEDSIFYEIRPFDRETPFTRFYDGMLHIATPENKEPQAGDVVTIVQYYPYDLQQRHETSLTRGKKIR